jgi:hypothetical protein
MSNEFRRTGDLKSIGSYPVWLQRVVHETAPHKRRVVEHELFSLMRDAKLPLSAMQRFMTGVWPTIEQFPRFMAMNLKKIGYGDSVGEDMARRYLIRTTPSKVPRANGRAWSVRRTRTPGRCLTMCALRRCGGLKFTPSMTTPTPGKRSTSSLHCSDMRRARTRLQKSGRPFDRATDTWNCRWTAR